MKDSRLVITDNVGDKVGAFIFLRNELVGKNKTWIVKCVCGEEKRFWRRSAILRQNTCGCGVDAVGLSKEQRRMLNSRLNSYKSGALKRGLSWLLTYEEFFELTTKNCAYCNSEPIRLNYFENAPSLQKESPFRDWSKYTIFFNGIDRIDSSLGYEKNNCTPCCVYCNRAKSDLNFENFKKHIEKIYKCLHQSE